jgi:hypothetical protein
MGFSTSRCRSSVLLDFISGALQTLLLCASFPHCSISRNACPKGDGRVVPSV